LLGFSAIGELFFAGGVFFRNACAAGIRHESRRLSTTLASCHLLPLFKSVGWVEPKAIPIIDAAESRGDG
jgi:hypothetical protein